MQQKESLINLESLIDLSARLNETTDENLIYNIALLSLMGKLRVLRACVLKPQKKKYNVLISKGSRPFDELSYFKLNEILLLDSENIKEKKQVFKYLYENGYVVLCPVISAGKLLAVICLGNKINKELLDEEEIHYLNLVGTISANSIKNAKNQVSIIEQKNKVQKHNQLLSTLFEISRSFSTLLSAEQILKMLSYNLMGQLMITKFSIFTNIKDTSNCTPIVDRFSICPDEEILKQLVTIDKVSTCQILRENALDDNKSKLCEYLENINAAIVSPMKIQGETKAIMIVGKKLVGTFSDEELQFLEALGNTAISALENERLFKQEIEKQRLENELNLALEIQKNLLPKVQPKIANYDIAGISLPSRHVGGDYFDFIEISNQQILFAIADVSGKGMPASLIMANVQAALRLLAPLNLSLSEMIEKINKLIFDNTSADKFVTFFFGILDKLNHKFIYINAGHNPPIFIKNNGEIIELSEGGLILGILENSFAYQEGEIELNEGDLICFFTDGVCEAKNTENEEYGEELLTNKLVEYHNLSSFEIISNLVQSVENFSGAAGQFDDITMIVLKRI